MVLHQKLFVPGMRRNLLSVCRIARDDFDFHFTKDRVSIRKNSYGYAWSFIVGDLYVLDFNNSMVGFSDLFLVHDTSSDSIKWHARLGHIGKDRMIRLAREGLLGSLTQVQLPTCESCVTGKAT